MVCVGGRLELERQAIPGSITELRQAIVRFAGRSHAGRDRSDDIALAAGEALGNVVLHAYRDASTPGRVCVEATADEEAVSVTVRDRGCGMQPRPDSPGMGLGMPLIAHVADMVEISDTNGVGASVRMLFRSRG
jgi:anti-sigma regulatory factor (Ser/Thr protein kinase)